MNDLQKIMMMLITISTVPPKRGGGGTVAIIKIKLLFSEVSFSECVKRYMDG